MTANDVVDLAPAAQEGFDEGGADAEDIDVDSPDEGRDEEEGDDDAAMPDANADGDAEEAAERSARRGRRSLPPLQTSSPALMLSRMPVPSPSPRRPARRARRPPPPR